jgi:hypothetical protein
MLNGAKKYDVWNKNCRSDALTELVIFSSQEAVCDFDFNSLHMYADYINWVNLKMTGRFSDFDLSRDNLKPVFWSMDIYL